VFSIVLSVKFPLVEAVLAVKLILPPLPLLLPGLTLIAALTGRVKFPPADILTVPPLPVRVGVERPAALKRNPTFPLPAVTSPIPTGPSVTSDIVPPLPPSPPEGRLLTLKFTEPPPVICTPAAVTDTLPPSELKA